MEEEREISISDYIRTIRKWKAYALLVLIVVVGTSLALTYISVPIYRATARILIERTAPRIVNIQEVMPIDASTSEFYQTQYTILKSRSLAQKVIQTLNLKEDKRFNPYLQGETKLSGEELDQRLTEKFLSQLNVQPVRNTRLVDISFEDRDPSLAATVANAVAVCYIMQSSEMKTKTSAEAHEFLLKQIEEQRKRLEESERALQNYKERYGIIELEPTSDQQSQNIAMQKLSGITQLLVQAQAERVSAESKYREIESLMAKGADLESIPQIANNYIILELKKNEAQLLTEISEASQKYGEKHPRMLQLKKQLEAVRARIKEEALKIVKAVENEYLMVKAKEERARKAVEAQKAEVQKLSEHRIKYNVLVREVQKNREMYENLLKRLKETGVEQEIEKTNISIVDRAEVPLKPVKPDKKKNLLLSVVLGLFAGVGLAFLLEHLDNSIKTPEDVRRYLGIPNLAIVPTIRLPKAKDGELSTLVVYHKPNGSEAETFRFIRTALIFSGSPKVVLVTSAVPGEGKTFIAGNLALVMAYAGEKVLLVDGDMRAPSLHKVFGLDGSRGLSNLLIGEEVVPLSSQVDKGVYVMPTEPVPPNPAELLGSRRMEDYIGEMKRQFDRVIIDSPPVMSASETSVLGKLSEAVILAVHGGKTARDMVIEAKQILDSVGAHIVGTIINNIKLEKHGYPYYRYYRYYYGYEDRGGQGKREHR